MEIKEVANQLPDRLKKLNIQVLEHESMQTEKLQKLKKEISQKRKALIQENKKYNELRKNLKKNPFSKKIHKYNAVLLPEQNLTTEEEKHSARMTVRLITRYGIASASACNGSLVNTKSIQDLNLYDDVKDSDVNGEGKNEESGEPTLLTLVTAAHCLENLPALQSLELWTSNGTKILNLSDDLKIFDTPSYRSGNAFHHDLLLRNKDSELFRKVAKLSWPSNAESNDLAVIDLGAELSAEVWKHSELILPVDVFHSHKEVLQNPLDFECRFFHTGDLDMAVTPTPGEFVQNSDRDHNYQVQAVREYANPDKKMRRSPSISPFFFAPFEEASFKFEVSDVSNGKNNWNDWLHAHHMELGDDKKPTPKQFRAAVDQLLEHSKLDDVSRWEILAAVGGWAAGRFKSSFYPVVSGEGGSGCPFLCRKRAEEKKSGYGPWKLYGVHSGSETANLWDRDNNRKPKNKFTEVKETQFQITITAPLALKMIN